MRNITSSDIILTFDSKKYYLENREELLQYSRKYKASHAEHYRKYSRKWYRDNRKRAIKKNNIWQRNNKQWFSNRFRTLKIEVIKHYSKTLSCKKCGIDDIRVLSMDHINGGGNKHIKQIGGNLYHWIKRKGFPSGFQVLCMNCQFIKRIENKEFRKGI